MDSNIFFCTLNRLAEPFNNWQSLKFKALLTIAFLATLNHNYDYDQWTLEKGRWIKIYLSQARDVTSWTWWSKLLFLERLYLDDLTTYSKMQNHCLSKVCMLFEGTVRIILLLASFHDTQLKVFFNWLSKAFGQLLWFWFYYSLRLTK